MIYGIVYHFYFCRNNKDLPGKYVDYKGNFMASILQIVQPIENTITNTICGFALVPKILLSNTFSVCALLTRHIL